MHDGIVFSSLVYNLSPCNSGFLIISNAFNLRLYVYITLAFGFFSLNIFYVSFVFGIMSAFVLVLSLLRT